MKPLSLTMQAFGPYAGAETIDFTKLGNRTMFVISGKTGAGKTTIFDGISYAIYGRASGEDRSGPELRSQFASDDLLTEVSLEFSLRQKTYRIKRSPQQEKKKERGGGTTQVGAKAELYLIDETGSPQLLASNVREVDEKIKEIMIIDSNQFRQILMIPQGEFRKLLTSDSKEKEIILQRLFHTEIYKRIEDRLKEEASLLKKTVEDQIEKRNSAIRSIKASEIQDLKEYVEAGSVNDVLLLPLLKEEIQALKKKLEQMSKEKELRQQERDRLQQRIFEAESTIKQLASLEELKRKKDKLDSEKETFKQKEIEAELAKKASLLGSQEQLCHRLKSDSDNITVQVEKLTIIIEKLTKNLDTCEKDYQSQLDREPERKAASDHVHKLENMKEDVLAYASIAKNVHELDASLNLLKKERAKNEQESKTMEERFKDLQSEKEKAEKAQISFFEVERSLEKTSLELSSLTKLEKHLQKLQLANQTYRMSQQTARKAEERLEDAKATAKELEQKWFTSQAAVLASTLKSGEPCPVCGSEHHPVPAKALDGFIPNETDLNAAREQIVSLEKERAAAEKSFIEADTHLKSLNEIKSELVEEIKNLRDGFTIEHLNDAILQTEAKQENLKQEQKTFSVRLDGLEKTKSALKKLDVDRERLQERIKHLDESLQSSIVQYTSKKTTLERMVEKIPEELRTTKEFEEKLRAATQWVNTLEQQFELARKNYQDAKERIGSEKARLEEAEKLLKEKNAELAAERDEFRKTMVAQGFENYQLYASAKKPEHEVHALESEIRSYREELRSVTDRFTELSALLKDIKKPDLESLQKEIVVLNETIKKAEAEYQDVNLRRRDNERIIEMVESLNEQMKVLEEKYKLIGHLYEISKGQNTYRITFERFVLAAFLDDILSEANMRLSKMTSGRYRLLRKTDRSKGNVQSGLELLVQDAYTGQERHVKTLSGGESFKASLSLALGLADVVQNYAGGVSLETMFIDEGFGTLDPESLDQAIEALIEIQSSGRLVGIISHVPELKERIDARLEVIATQTGSRTEFYLVN